VQAESADRNIDRRQRADHADARDVQRHFFVRLAQRRLLECFAGIDHASRERHLAAVPAQRIGANGQHHVRVVVVRIEEQQSGGVADARGIEASGPRAARDRSEAFLCSLAGQLTGKAMFEKCDDVVETHGCGIARNGLKTVPYVLVVRL
jgi:hypothetical protein